MPSVEDIVSVAEALEKSPVAVVRDRCVAVRNRNATCRRCMDVCAADALQVSGNEITLSTLACTSCGACTAVCPTEALVPLVPSDADLLKAARNAKSEGARVVIACARMASKRLADPQSYAEVPCLSRVDESVLLSLAADGSRCMLLVDGECATCKHRDNEHRINDVVASANNLMSAMGSQASVSRMTGFPDDMLGANLKGAFGTTRRGFFSDAVASARETVATAARTTISNELGHAVEDVAIGERLRVTPDGTLPLIRVPRHDAVINALDVLGSPVVEEIDSRMFGSVSVDATACNSCGMCVRFCPTGALRRHPDDDARATLKRMEFSASDCIQCFACSDVCWKQALTLKSVVSAEELFDFEPTTILL